MNPAEPVVTMLVCFIYFAREAAGAVASGVPHTLSRVKVHAQSGRFAPRACGLISQRHWLFENSITRRVGRGALAPCPPLSVQIKMVGTLALCHPTNYFSPAHRLQLLKQNRARRIRDVNHPLTGFVYAPSTISPARCAERGPWRMAYHGGRFRFLASAVPLIVAAVFAGGRLVPGPRALHRGRRRVGPAHTRSLACRPACRFHRRSGTGHRAGPDIRQRRGGRFRRGR